MKESDVRQELDDLADALTPLTQEQFDEQHQYVRAKRLRACLNFKNYIWGLVSLGMMLGIIVRICFGVVNLISSIDLFGNPVAICASFTAILGALIVSMFVIDALYSSKQIGCKDLDFTHEELHELAKSENAYFAPGCFYDCRIIENNIDIDSTRVFLPIIFFYSLLVYWMESPGSSVPDTSTPDGIRYALGHSVLFGFECMSILVLVSNMYAMWRRRPRIDTLRIEFWFDIKRYWEEDERESPGVIMQ